MKNCLNWVEKKNGEALRLPLSRIFWDLSIGDNLRRPNLIKKMTLASEPKQPLERKGRIGRERKRKSLESFWDHFRHLVAKWGWSDFFDKVVQKACVLSVKVVATPYFAAEWRTWHAKNLVKHMKTRAHTLGQRHSTSPRFAREAARNPQCKHCLGNIYIYIHLLSI